MNSWVLFDLGAQTEENFGTGRYLGFYFVSTIMGFYASFLWSPAGVSIGASAGILGLIGAVIALGVRDRSAYGTAVRRRAGRCMDCSWGCFPFSRWTTRPIRAGGFAVAYLAGTPRYSETTERLWQIAAGAAVALTAAAFGYTVKWLTTSGA